MPKKNLNPVSLITASNLPRTKKRHLKGTLTLEQLLSGQNMMSGAQIMQAHAFMADNFCNFGTAVMYLNLVPPAVLSSLLHSELKIQTVKPGEIGRSVQMRHLVPEMKVREYQAMPLAVVEENGQKVLLLGMTDPLESFTAVKIEELCRMKVQPVFISLEDLQELLKHHFRSGLRLFPPEFSAYHELTAKRRVEAVQSQPTDLQQALSLTDLRALVSLLIKKGIITIQELQQEKKGAPTRK